MYADTYPVNVLKYCPRCGSGHFSATSNRSFKCKDCTFDYYVNSAAAVAVLIFNEKNELLFTRRAVEPNKGKLDLPGGFIELMETAEQAAVREIQEELGIEIHSLKYFCSFPNEYVFSEYSVFTLDLAFLAQTDQLCKMKAMDDVLSFEFYKPEKVNMDELPSFSMKNILKKLIHSERNY